MITRNRALAFWNWQPLTRYMLNIRDHGHKNPGVVEFAQNACSFPAKSRKNGAAQRLGIMRGTLFNAHFCPSDVIMT